MGGGGELCLGMVVASCAVYGGVLLKVLRFFFFFSSFVEIFGFGICWRTGGCSSGCCGGGSWLVVTARAVCLYIVGF